MDRILFTAKLDFLKILVPRLPQNSSNVNIECAGKYIVSGADPAFVMRGGPNSEHFLSNLRKLVKRGKCFLTTQKETELT